MFTLENPLLQHIKSTVAERLARDSHSMSTLMMTDQLRYDILDILVTYSDKVPHPASSADSHANPLIRWQVLAYVASIDLTIAKWFESHLDALSILQELDYDKATTGLWAVWAAEGHPLYYQDGKVNGKKAWCSGANSVDYGLLTYRDEQGRSCLLTVAMQQDGIESDYSAWQAVGMQATDTATIQFTQVVADEVGNPNAYLDRVGFWHGAAGVAACWYGATTTLASYLISAYQQKPNDYKAMYLGQISTALAVTRQYFQYVAELTHTQPQRSHELVIRALRANVEQVARQVLDSVGQALGAAPFCNDAHFARLAADLPVFIRQSHGAFDLQKIGELTSASVSHASSDSIAGQEYLWSL